MIHPLPHYLFTLLCLACLAAAPTTQPHLEYSLLITGGELLEGAYPDSHTLFITRTLHPLGLHCVSSMIVDDNPDDIKSALRFAAAKTKLIITTGGLGPTDNDLTRQSLTDFTGIPLKEHPDVLADMERRFKSPRDQLRANLRRQTQTPTRGTYLKNASGTAVGLVFEMPDGTVVVSLPGPPRELQPMVRDELLPYLIKRFGVRPPGASLTIRFVGLGQSQISQTLTEKVPLPPDAAQFSQFEASRVDFSFVLPNDTPQDRARLDDLKQNILKHLGDNIYATDETSLEEHVAQLLRKRNASLSLAESGTAGALSAALGTAPSASTVLMGAFAAPTDDKLRRLLHIPDEKWNPDASPLDRAKLIANSLTDSTYAIVIGQIERDPTGATNVQVVFKLPANRLETQIIPLRGTGELARASITTQLLDHLRRKLR